LKSQNYLKKQGKTRKFLPKEASIRNPVDMIASAKPEHYYMAVKEVSQDSNVDIIAIIYLPPNEIPPEEVGKEIIKAMRELSERKNYCSYNDDVSYLNKFHKRRRPNDTCLPFP